MLWDNILWGCTWCQGPRNRDRIAACAHRLHPLRAEGLVVRADMNPSALLPSIHQIVQRADPEQPISHVRLLEDIVGDRIAPRAAQARVLGGFAGVAMLLAAIGLYGLLAFGVSRRMREIGPADGARRHTPGSMIGLIVKRGVALALIGTLLPAIRASRVSPLEATRD